METNNLEDNDREEIELPNERNTVAETADVQNGNGKEIKGTPEAGNLHSRKEKEVKWVLEQNDPENGHLHKRSSDIKNGNEKKKALPNASAVEMSDVYMEEEQTNQPTSWQRFKRLTLKEKIRYIRDIITVEPLIVCYFMATTLCSPALFLLEFEKACKANEGYNDTVCDEIVYGEAVNLTDEFIKIQTRITNMHSWQQPLQNIMPIILVLFLGSYSDRHKLRKPFLLIPIIGEFFAVVGCILCVVFMRGLPLEAQGVFQTVVPAFFGSSSMLIMATFAYIADVSTVEMRTLRIGIVQFILTFCAVVIQSFSGTLFIAVGYLWMLIFTAALFAIGLLYGIFYIKEPKQPVTTESRKEMIKDIFDPKNAIETFKVLTQKKKGNSRLLIVLLLFNAFNLQWVNQGELSLFFLFVKSVYKWNPPEYTLYGSINTAVHMVGTVVFLPLFTIYMKLSDLIIGTLTFLDKVVCNLIITFYLAPMGLYIGTIVSIFVGIASTAIRSQATKIVNPDDLGKSQSLFAVAEAIAPAISTPIYNTVIYNNTLEVFPSAFILVGCVAQLIGAIIFLFMYNITRRKTKAAKTRDDKQAYAYENQSPDILETTHI